MSAILQAGQLVRLNKLSAHVTSEGALPVDYWLEGYLDSDLKVDEPIQVNRTRRARQRPDEPAVVERTGLYTSSPIVALEKTSKGMIATTQNSRWEIIALDKRN